MLLVKILSIILGIVLLILFFSFTIFIHEFGHFIAGKIFGLKAPVFSIGFGPCLWKKTIKGTEFRISAIPLGGFVSLPELDPTGMELIQGDGETKIENVKPAIWWKRIIVAAAGPFGNVLFAILLSWIVYASYSNSRPQDVPEEVRLIQNGVVVAFVEPDTPEAESGLRVGDVIHEVNDRQVEIFAEFLQEVHTRSENGFATVCVSNMLDGAEACLRIPVEKGKDDKFYSIKNVFFAHNLIIKSVMPDSPAQEAGIKGGDYLFECNGKHLLSSKDINDAVEQGGVLNFKLFRNGSFVDVQVEPKFNNEYNRFMIGIQYDMSAYNVRPWMKYRKPWDQIKGDSEGIFRILGSLFAPTKKGEAARTVNALGGPISIFTMMWLTLGNFVSFLAFVRFLNINLAILNLLPIPILDGGHIIFALWRGIFQKELSEKVITWLCNAFALLLIVFFIFISCKDVFNVWSIFSSSSNKEEKVEAVESPADKSSEEELFHILEDVLDCSLESPADNSSEKELPEDEEYVEVIEEGE